MPNFRYGESNGPMTSSDMRHVALSQVTYAVWAFGSPYYSAIQPEMVRWLKSTTESQPNHTNMTFSQACDLLGLPIDTTRTALLSKYRKLRRRRDERTRTVLVG